jgi:hypothetical protein
MIEARALRSRLEMMKWRAESAFRDFYQLFLRGSHPRQFQFRPQPADRGVAQ